jgi:hypothetical protein
LAVFYKQTCEHVAQADTGCTGKSSSTTSVAFAPHVKLIDEKAMEKDMLFLEHGHELLGRQGPIAEAHARATEAADGSGEKKYVGVVRARTHHACVVRRLGMRVVTVR